MNDTIPTVPDGVATPAPSTQQLVIEALAELYARVERLEAELAELKAAA